MLILFFNLVTSSVSCFVAFSIFIYSALGFFLNIFTIFFGVFFTDSIQLFTPFFTLLIPFLVLETTHLATSFAPEIAHFVASLAIVFVQVMSPSFPSVVAALPTVDAALPAVLKADFQTFNAVFENPQGKSVRTIRVADLPVLY